MLYGFFYIYNCQRRDIISNRLFPFNIVYRKYCIFVYIDEDIIIIISVFYKKIIIL